MEAFGEAGCTTVVMCFTSPDQAGEVDRCLAKVIAKVIAVLEPARAR